MAAVATLVASLVVGVATADATEVAPAHPGHLKPRRLWLADPK